MPLKPLLVVMIVAIVMLASAIWATTWMPWDFTIIFVAIIAIVLGIVISVGQMFRDRDLRSGFRIKFGTSLIIAGLIIISLIFYFEGQPVTSYHPPGPIAERVFFL